MFSAKGIMAKIMGTAPLSPTHEINALSFIPMLLKGHNVIKTLSGRATNIITKLIIKPGISTGNNSCGFTNSPSVRNIINCESHASPSKKLSELFLCTNSELPMTKPPM